MTDQTNIRKIRHAISFTIDGQRFSTCDRRQQAAELLRLGGLDPALFDLGELSKKAGHTKRFADDEEVRVHNGARFVSIRHCADVA